ncbi:CHC2 zinc finger domain-containing protein [Dethiosulfatarculus sandiegensis]|uniref:Zinc finger CHC2-type domain-containing protein n=1 Tax=Dethiosulfatarculus sandiegensis TaxID=1429043 RepID=A0A0D2J377_9BACT|nr:CHC2 zinc finger domain-containing protein [Dethiosulfatarculus sandiegensis]KIX12644.1 hypothetical protein X474_18020 [Dethiosulfatarculus sandiegensis]
MSWALDHLSRDQRLSILESLEGQSKASGSWQMTLCPFHNDHTPSFGYDPDKDCWKCFAGCGNDDMMNLWARIHGTGDKKADFKAFVARYGDEEPSKKAKPGRKTDNKLSRRTASPDEFITEQEFKDLALLPESWIKQLQKKRGWSRAFGQYPQVHYRRA